MPDSSSLNATIEPLQKEIPFKKAGQAAPLTRDQRRDVPLDTMLPNAGGNIFCLIRMAMVRAMEIHEGSKPLVEHDPLDKPTSIALQEIAQSKVVYGNK